MPTYTFIDENGEQYDKVMKIAEVDQYLKEHPTHTKGVNAPGLIGGISMDSGRLPDGFKDKLRDIQSKHPRANGIKHLI